MPNNFFDFIQFIRMQSNPQQILLNMLKEGQAGQQNNLVLANIIRMAENNQTKEIEQVARNLFKEQGLDFDKEFNSFKQQFNLK